MTRSAISRRSALSMILASISTLKPLPAINAMVLDQAQNGMAGQGSEPARPKYHLTPALGWINDPQRPLWMNNVWNLWILWNGDYPTGRGTSWRRFTSSDLVTWTDQGVSIPKNITDYGDSWTGSSVVDIRNTAGHGAGAVIALMTMASRNLGGQSTGLWYSTDGGASFKFDSIVQVNPKAGNKTIRDLTFRDPSVLWHAPSGLWVMCLAEIGKISIYTSPDLKKWTYRSALVRSDLGTLECPNMIQLHLYDQEGRVVGNKWILLCGANGTEKGFTVGTYYWIGSFDGIEFRPDSQDGQWLDHGPDFYAAALFNDAAADDPLARAFAVAWESNWSYVRAFHGRSYIGQLNMIRQLRLQVVNDKPTLLSTPVDAQNKVFNSVRQGSDQTIQDTKPYKWPTNSNSAHARIDFTLGRALSTWPKHITLQVRSGRNYATQILFEPAKNSVTLNRDRSGPSPTTNDAWKKTYTAFCDFSSPVNVSVFVDSESVDMFVNDGRATISALITAPEDATDMHLTVSDGSVKVSNVIVRNDSLTDFGKDVD